MSSNPGVSWSKNNAIIVREDDNECNGGTSNDQAMPATTDRREPSSNDLIINTAGRRRSVGSNSSFEIPEQQHPASQPQLPEVEIPVVEEEVIQSPNDNDVVFYSQFSAEVDRDAGSSSSSSNGRCSPKGCSGSQPTGNAGDESKPSGHPVTLAQYYEDATKTEAQPRKRVHAILNGAPSMQPDQKIAMALNTVHVLMILVSVIVFMVDTLPSYTDPDKLDVSSSLFIIESITIAFFTLDLFIKLVIFESWIDNWGSLTIDFVSIIGFYLEIAIFFASGETGGQLGVLVLLRLARLGRVLRVFKLSRYNKGLQLIMRVLQSSGEGLFLLFFLVSIATVLFSTMLYYAEQTESRFDEIRERWVRRDGTDSPFQSIPHTFWVVVVTISTVGYGVEVPHTLLGKYITGLIMLFGVLVLSFPNILVGSNFQNAHRMFHRARARKRLGIYFRRVRMIVRFIRMYREFSERGTLGVIGKTRSRAQSFANTVHAMQATGDATMALTGGSTAASTAATKVTQRKLNFFFTHADFPQFNYQREMHRLQGGMIEDWEFSSLSGLAFLQRLFEGFSGVATFVEYAVSLRLYSLRDVRRIVSRDDLLAIMCHLSNAGLLSMYVVNREEWRLVIAITQKSINLLTNYNEDGTMPCVRCLKEAKDIWFQTTSRPLPDVPRMEGYLKWSKATASMTRRSVVDFTYDHKAAASKRNDIFSVQTEALEAGCGASGAAGSASAGGSGFGVMCLCQKRDLADEDFLRMRVEIAKNDLKIYLMQKQVLQAGGSIDGSDKPWGSFGNSLASPAPMVGSGGDSFHTSTDGSPARVSGDGDTEDARSYTISVDAPMEST